MGSHDRTAGQRSLVQPPRLVMLLLLLSPRTLSCSASSVITHLPGFPTAACRSISRPAVTYVDVEAETGTELFYYFVESEKNPDTDPLILWPTGGPRCSGFCGLVYEVG
ncbi:hypothetical protein E2562_028239 [Oryza meyeriana var. granulata]|uniref:Uncharacterized protein n=1 Tax=Oryza meyeriana var. granulata TaxID=110450 RepID=A0A6G1DPC3_9ORYZ|nr:hypothetical protein E2562_028239 [Oryza meyeriana var. granulata]